jgi:hypothetical protein
VWENFVNLQLMLGYEKYIIFFCKLLSK